MKNNIRLSLLLIFVFIATILYGFVNKLTAPRILSNEELLINGFYKLQEPIALSDFSLEREDGSYFTKSDLIDKWTIMYFGFSSCPTECPVTMSELRKLINTLREKNFILDDKQWVLVSIDPERDTPDMIDKYAKGFDKDFIGVSNARPMLLSLATQLSVNNVMPDHSNHMDHSHLDNHVNNIILLNPNGDFAGIFRPPFDVARLSLTYQSVTN